ncbi:MAG: energy transducer TonB [Prevotella sp.]|nr:energy transducer TonB [Prevotella sp.]MBR1485565.1 energy transducer TonB [Prevotella sp.]
MEVKKSSKADLEHLRPQGFLLGFVLALSCLFVALEYTITPSDPLDDPDLLEMFASDSELGPLLRPENELALAPKAEPEPTVRLKVVDDDSQQELKQPDEPVETDLDGDMSETDADEPEPTPDADEEPKLRVVEGLPEFPGGPLEFIKWLTRNLKYPPSAQSRKVQGKVVAEFVVNTDGSVTDVRVVKSLNEACDHEALRVLRMMPRWTPGIENDKPCRTKVCIPIVFRL